MAGAAAAAVLDTAKYKSKVMLTGLGTPDEMKKYVADGTVTLSDNTLSSNQAGRGNGGNGGSDGTAFGGGIDNAAGPGALQIYDTIIAGDTANTADPDLDGSVISLGHNLIGNSIGGNGFVASDLVNVNPLLNTPSAEKLCWVSE